jgi:hypothetical protein
MKTFDYIQDAGHGWIKVPVFLLESLHIADKVSHFSYYRAGYGYLEEDSDAALFFNAYHAKFGADPKLRDRISDRSRVRNYAQYNAAKHTYAHHLTKLIPNNLASLRINAITDIQGA